MLDGCCRHGHIESVGTEVAQHDGCRYGKYGDAGGNHACSYTFYDYRCRTGLACLGYVSRRTVALGGVVLRCLTDNHTCRQTGDDREADTQPVFQSEKIQDYEAGNCDEQGGRIGTESQGMQQIFHCRPFFSPYQEDAEQAEEHTHGGDEHRGDDGPQLHITRRGGKGGCTQGCRGENRTAVALVEVGSHAGHIADIVAHVVGDCRRIARVVLGDVRLHLAHKVSSHVGRLRVDAAAYTGEQCLRRGTHTEGQHGCRYGDEHLACRHLVRVEPGQDDEPQCNVKQSQADDDQSHDCSGAEGDLESVVQSFPCGIGCSGTGIGGCFHSEEPGQSREEPSCQESERNPGVLCVETVGHDGEDSSQNDEYDQDDLVLLLQVGHGSSAYVFSNLSHAGCAFLGLDHGLEEIPCHSQRAHGSNGNEPEYLWNVFHIQYVLGYCNRCPFLSANI